jgi:hypothetical protein
MPPQHEIPWARQKPAGYDTSSENSWFIHPYQKLEYWSIGVLEKYQIDEVFFIGVHHHSITPLDETRLSMKAPLP